MQGMSRCEDYVAGAQRMIWDIVIAAGVGLTQLVITWYAVDISVREKRLKNAIIIGVIGIVGIGLTVSGAIRNGIAQNALQSQLNKIQNNTEKPEPTPVVNVAPPHVNIPSQSQHTHVLVLVPNTSATGNPVFPLKEGERVEINVGFRDLGQFPVLSPRLGGILKLVPISEDGKVWEKYAQEVKLGPPSSNLISVNDPTIEYLSYFLDSPLSKQDVEDLTALPPKKEVCALAKVDWRDDTGHYETQYVGCLSNTGDATFPWHNFGNSNKELRLGN
jgi:hypothetical protein